MRIRKGAFNIFTWLSFFSVSLCSGQNRTIDSLRNILGIAKGDTNKVNILSELCKNLYLAGHYDSILPYGFEAQKLAEKLDFKKGIAYSYLVTGSIYLKRDNYPAALNCFLKSLEIYEVISNKKGIANSLINLGNIYYQENNYTNALGYYVKTLKICEQLGNKQLVAFSLNNIGNIYKAKGDYGEAMAYHTRALKIRREINDPKGISYSLNNIGEIYDILKDYYRAMEYYNEAMEIKEKIEDRPGICLLYVNMGLVYFHQKKYKYCEKYFEKSMGLAKENRLLDVLSENSKQFSALYEKEARYPEALSSYKAFIIYRDSIFNEENTKKMVRSEMNFEFEKKEASARAEQEQRDLLAEADAKRQRIILVAISTFGLMVLVFAVFIFRGFLQKQRTNREITKQKHIIEVKQKEILDSIQYAKRIQQSLLPTEKYIDRKLKNKGNDPVA